MALRCCMVRRIPALALLLAFALCAVAAPFARAQTTIAPAPTTATPAMLGGWSNVAVTATESELLQRALANVSSYRADVTARVCVVEIRSAARQVVAGTNYRFIVQACAVSSDKSVGTCAVKTVTMNASVCSDYAIRVFEQLGKNALEVVAIELLSSTEPSSAPAPASSSPSATATTPSTTPSPRATNSSSTSDTVDKDSNAAKTSAPTPTTAVPANAAAHVVMSSVLLIATAVLASLSA